MKSLFSKRGVAVFCALLLTVFLVRPGAERLRGRVTQSMSQALGRSVEIESVHLRFLPRLGFDLGNVIIHDDPAFGLEPLMRAPEVTASLSMGALLRGKIAIASLTLSDASLNLTRNSQGKWNVEDLIERTSRTSLAPTAAGHQLRRASFPYVEAKHARVNFKSGVEKLHFAFANSEFGLWQESEDTWGARLQATPIRSDANLTDTGVIKLEGLWRRAARAHETPLQISFQWKQAQVGQLSTLFYGEDKGWRGSLLLSGALIGQPEHLKITADASVDGFRREDVLGGGELALSAHCGGEYSSSSHTLTNVDCVAPSGSGMVEVKGSGTPGSSAASLLASYDLWLVADKVPAGSALSLLRHINSDIPEELDVAGELDATVQLHKLNSEGLTVEGRGSAEQLELSSATAGSVPFGTIPLTVLTGAATHPQQASSVRNAIKQRVRLAGATQNPAGEGPRIEVGPVNLSTSKSPLQARATVSLAGYEASVTGDAGVKRLLQLSHVLGIPSPTVAADGTAAVNLAISGSFHGERPLVEGHARLRSVRAQVRGLNAPLEITSADLSIEREVVKIQNLVAATGNVVWRGSLQVPRPCRGPAACPFEFDLRTAELGTAELNQLLNPAMAQKAWYSFLSLNSGQQPFLVQTQASGKIVVDKLKLGSTPCLHFSAGVRLNSGEVEVADIQGDVLGGHASGDWTADFASKPPKYAGKGSLEGVVLSQVAELMHDGWIDGIGTVKYDVSAAGSKLHDVVNSADVNANFTVTRGVFAHVVLPDAARSLHADSFSGNLRLQDGEFTFDDAKLKSGSGVYKVSGTALLNGALGLKFTGETTPSYALSGTVLKTRVTTIPVAQAALKP